MQQEERKDPVQNNSYFKQIFLMLHIPYLSTALCTSTKYFLKDVCGQ